ncbi:lysine-specific demethylase lid [Drosophila innubila]|uniref:lysine-specific demethylase lid n=1 Tax=Drosophila innubila TaxID=198719 RepID=UPI00148BBF62|nr:lysine-specific demethylase lid [Drosophila innubila]XP_034472197.1 lysine-specific demethylase lid [Drosophila innubila]XP_034472198.1 lysine-specific demethylase lid [Drosophila innubila]
MSGKTETDSQAASGGGGGGGTGNNSNSNGSATPARRLRTRNSTGSGSESAKKSINSSSHINNNNNNSSSNNNNNNNNNSETAAAINEGTITTPGSGTATPGSVERPMPSVPMNHASSSVSASKKYHNSCPHPTPTVHKKTLHTKPHSSNKFDQGKNEEFHFDTPPECPVFRPTAEEFKNPLAYISKIRSIAEKCGIAKILPPEKWSPPFAVDVDKLHFVPRVQRLNELEAKTRVKLNFLDQIAKFWELQGSSLKIPMVERKALDLYTLHRIVQEEGGMEQTTKERKWAKVANRMQYPSSKSVGATLKAHYERILHPFEVYTSGKVLGPAAAAAAASVTPVKLEDCGTDYKTHEIPTRQQIAPPNENNTRRSKRFGNSTASCGLVGAKPGAAGVTIKTETKEDFKRDLLSSFNAVNSAGAGANAGQSAGGGTAPAPNTRATQKKASTEPQQPLIDPLMKYICHICNRGDVEESMLLCDGCDDSYHTFCLLPPLSSIPKGEWLCPRCVVEEVSKPQEAFGFEQAEREYTLQQFGQMADQFKQEYFRKPVHLVPTEMVEREFWRIVSSIDEDVTVEYGADLHTMDHGSGFPTKSSLYLLPGDQEYAESSWNLNNLPLLEDSILGHINADISGMNAPWMYVGMCFAAFCWHNEDHWSYSINYLHWGEPKTWYGVPGSCAEQFEETMKRAAPELFSSQPDLLHQLVTIMNPNILMNNGVPVYRTDQHAGEFVITFPRAYHAGFNQGYNFAEAVNFAPADWLKMGRECVNHYSMLRRFCVFSHDELVCKMALEPAKLTFGIATACYIDMAEMVDTEKKLRKSLLEWGVTRAERRAFELVNDDERHCQECNTTCFLSAVACECNDKLIVCLRHYTVLCGCAPEKHTLIYRYTLDEMPLMLQKLKVKAHSFERWLSRCRDIVDAHTPTSVTLSELQELCKEAETKKFPSSLLIDRLNAAAIEAEKCVTVIQQLGINKVRTRSDHNQEAAQYKLTMEELELFVQEIDNLCCIIDEGTSVRELLVLGRQFVDRAESQLQLSLEALEENDLETLINEGSSLRIELQQLDQLQKRLKQCKWYKRSQGLRETSSKLTYNDVKTLLHTAAADLDPTDPYVDREMRKLQQIGAAIEAWESQAAKFFRRLNQQHDLVEIEQFLKSAGDINGQVPSHGLLKDALRKAREWLRSVEQLQQNNHVTYCHTLEAMIERGLSIPIQLEELSRMQGHLNSAHQWKENTARAFLKKGTFYTLLEVLMPRADAINIDSDLKPRFQDDFLKDKNPAEIVASFKHAEEQELRDMRDLRRQNMSKNMLRDFFCLCKTEFRGLMHNCQLCRDWFHDDCVPPPPSHLVAPQQNGNTGAAVNGNNATMPGQPKWLCPSCVRSKRPRLETILPLLVQLQQLPMRLPEDEALRCLAERAMNWQDRARKALSSPDVSAALEAIISQQLKRRSESNSNCAAVLGSISSPRKPRRMHNLSKQENNTSTARSESDAEDVDDVDDDDDDDECRLRIVEDGYSNDEDEQQTRLATSNAQCSSTDLLKLLSDSEIENLLELMMEGDLLEVSLDETQELWRILETMPPTILQAEARSRVAQHMQQLQQQQRQQQSSTITAPTVASSSSIHSGAEDSNDSLLVQNSPSPGTATATGGSGVPGARNKKRRSNDASGGNAAVPRKKQNTPKQTPGKKSTALRKSDSKASTSPGVDADAENKQANGGNTTATAATTAAAATTTPTAAGATTTATVTPSPAAGHKKRKRTTTTNNNNINNNNSGSGSNNSSGNNNSNAVGGTPTAGNNNTPTGGGGGQKKHAQRSQQTAQEDDEEECRAENCHKPTGREVDWVQCDGGCNEWFHMYCVGLNRSQIKADDDYICIRCSKTVSVGVAGGSSSLTVTTTTTTSSITLNTTTPGKQRAAQSAR